MLFLFPSFPKKKKKKIFLGQYIFAFFSCNFSLLELYDFHSSTLCLTPGNKENTFKTIPLYMILKMSFLSVEFYFIVTILDSSDEASSGQCSINLINHFHQRSGRSQLNLRNIKYTALFRIVFALHLSVLISPEPNITL